MKFTYQYRIYPDAHQKVKLNHWLRICRYWYNGMLGERFQWWEENRCAVNSCPLITHLPELKDNPNYFSQKKQLPVLKKDLIMVQHSKELLDLGEVYSTVLQEVCDRVKKAFNRYIQGDKNGKRSGQPRFKNTARYRTLTFPNADDEWLKFCTVNRKWLFVQIPSIGLMKVRHHRPLPHGAKIKQISLTKKADEWYINFSLEDKTIPDFTPDEITPTWNNSMGLDAVLHENSYLATSEGELIESTKPLRRKQEKLAQVSRKKNKRKKGSKCRRKLAKREARLHAKIARCRRDFHYKTAHKLVRTGKKFFFYEDLNLQGLTKRNNPKQDALGNYLPNGQATKSGLNKSWLDAGFGQFFTLLGQVAVKANARAIPKKPQYTSQLLAYKDEFIFTELSQRVYWDEELQIAVDRDINSALNLKRLGLDLFPSIKRRRGKPVIIFSDTKSTSKEILTVLKKASEAYTVFEKSV